MREFDMWTFVGVVLVTLALTWMVSENDALATMIYGIVLIAIAFWRDRENHRAPER